MNLTFSLDEVKESVSKEEGYEAIHAVHQLARAYGVRVEELDELIKEPFERFFYSIQIKLISVSNDYISPSFSRSLCESFIKVLR